jgi:hypothetical protein
VNHAIFLRLTMMNAGINFATGVIRIFMLAAMSANLYLIMSRVVFFPLSVLFFLLCYRWITREAIRIWPVDMPPPPEWRSAENALTRRTIGPDP